MITPLDHAHAAMEAAPDDAAARLGFYARLADAELFLLLEEEAKGDQISPRIFETGDGAFALVFDREERLTAFTGETAPYAALSGRALVEMLRGSGIGIGLNLSVAPSSALLPPDALTWLREQLDAAPSASTAQPRRFHPPKIPEVVVQALATKLATASGLAESAWLARVEYDGGSQNHLLAFVAARREAEPALAQSIQDVLTFSGLDAAAIDVTFLEHDAQITRHLAKVGLRFDIPKPETPKPPSAPGMNPDAPPKLR